VTTRCTQRVFNCEREHKSGARLNRKIAFRREQAAVAGRFSAQLLQSPRDFAGGHHK